MKIILTGASGFVGRAAYGRLHDSHDEVVPVVRSLTAAVANTVLIGDFNSEHSWDPILRDAECVVYCAARVHLMHDKSSDPLSDFRQVNVETTLRVASLAVKAGVKRFVFLSSLKVLGDKSPLGAPFRADSKPNPEDAYARSKWEAEQALCELSLKSGLEVVIIRPPLVYGPGVKANFQSLVRAIARGIPLPLGRVHNLRSLVALDNLCDLIRVCVEHPAAAGQTFLVSDGHDVSTPDLARAIGTALGRPARLIPVPVSWLNWAGRLSGKDAQIERITGSLQVDIGHTTRVLGWSPGVTLQQQLQSLAQHYRS